MPDKKAKAKEFLDDLQSAMNDRLPRWQEIQAEIPDIVSEAKGREDWKHKRTPEDVFLHHFAFPILFQYISDDLGHGNDAARQSLLSEFFRNMPDMVSGSPARAMRYGNPFGKVFATPQDVMKRWRGEMRQAKVQQPCPDFALRSPFPHKIIFEGKYFQKGGITAGETHLVETSYQAFFYGAQTPAGENSSGVPWDYDYSCLFACDASNEAGLISAWNSLDGDLQNSFWEGANIYIMVLRPE